MNDKQQYAKSRLDPDLWKRARAAALRMGVSLRAWLDQAIHEKLERDGE